MNILAQFSGTFLRGARKVSYKSLAVRSIQVKTIKKHSLGLYVGCPRPLNRAVRLIEVEFTVSYWVNFRDFDNCPLNKGCPPDTGPNKNWGNNFCYFYSPYFYSALYQADTLYLADSCQSPENLLSKIRTPNSTSIKRTSLLSGRGHPTVRTVPTSDSHESWHLSPRRNLVWK